MSFPPNRSARGRGHPVRGEVECGEQLLERRRGANGAPPNDRAAVTDSGPVQQRPRQRGDVALGEYEAVPVGPDRVGGDRTSVGVLHGGGNTHGGPPSQGDLRPQTGAYRWPCSEPSSTMRQTCSRSRYSSQASAIRSIWRSRAAAKLTLEGDQLRPRATATETRKAERNASCSNKPCSVVPKVARLSSRAPATPVEPSSANHEIQPGAALTRPWRIS